MQRARYYQTGRQKATSLQVYLTNSKQLIRTKKDNESHLTLWIVLYKDAFPYSFHQCEMPAGCQALGCLLVMGGCNKFSAKHDCTQMCPASDTALC